MTQYTVTIEESMNAELTEIAHAAGISVEDLLHDFIASHLDEARGNLVIQQYKEGNLKAREAWKLSGLSYQEFQDKVNS